MKLRIHSAFVLSFALMTVAVAQTPQMPKPGPEQNRLQYFVGAWHSEYELKPGPFGPGGKMTNTDRSELMPGGFFLITHTEGKGALGDLKELALMGYDTEAKAYTYDAYNNFGQAEHFKGAVNGDTWTWTAESMMGGKPAKMRFIAKEVSPTSYTMKLELAGDSGWITVMEGKATKIK